jgi:hypothetical protein
VKDARRSPAKEKRAAREFMIPIRMGEDELRVLRAAAKGAGLGLGPWLRMLGLREAQRETCPHGITGNGPPSPGYVCSRCRRSRTAG